MKANGMSEHTDYLFERVIYQMVLECIDFDELRELEEQLAVELGRRPGISDEQLLAVPRALIARALRELASCHEHGEYVDDRDLRDRYLNAICREVDPGAKAG